MEDRGGIAEVAVEEQQGERRAVAELAAGVEVGVAEVHQIPLQLGDIGAVVAFVQVAEGGQAAVEQDDRSSVDLGDDMIRPDPVSGLLRHPGERHGAERGRGGHEDRPPGSHDALHRNGVPKHLPPRHRADGRGRWRGRLRRHIVRRLDENGRGQAYDRHDDHTDGEPAEEQSSGPERVQCRSACREPGGSQKPHGSSPVQQLTPVYLAQATTVRLAEMGSAGDRIGPLICDLACAGQRRANSSSWSARSGAVRPNMPRLRG